MKPYCRSKDYVRNYLQVGRDVLPSTAGRIAITSVISGKIIQPPSGDCWDISVTVNVIVIPKDTLHQTITIRGTDQCTGRGRLLGGRSRSRSSVNRGSEIRNS